MAVVTRDPERTRHRILEAATEEFARYGLGGARVDRIAVRAGANKRMLYYYFRDKDNLFLAALEARYADIRAAERALDLEHLEPREALRRLVAFTWQYFLDHPEFLTLLNSANQELEKLKQEALKLYGTSDVKELEAKLRQMEDENLKLRRDYQKLLDKIEEDLQSVEERG